MTMKAKRAGAWMIFLLCLLALSFSATPYSRTANQVLVGARLALVAVLSVLTIREWWKKQKEPSPSSDSTDGFLQRWRRWYHDEPKREPRP
jgi:hypothetical protein